MNLDIWIYYCFMLNIFCMILNDLFVVCKTCLLFVKHVCKFMPSSRLKSQSHSSAVRSVLQTFTTDQLPQEILKENYKSGMIG